MVFIPVVLSGCGREYLDKDKMDGHVARIAGVRKTYRIFNGKCET
jgi:hypothetical protein